MTEDRTDVGDEQQVSSKRISKKATEQFKLEELQQLLSQRPFRDWLWELLTFCRIYDSGFHSDPHFMAFQSGKREVGLRVLAEISKANPKIYSQMQIEANPNV